MSYGPSNAMNQYQKVGAYGAAYADPHRLIQMLMEGVLGRVAAAKGAMQRGDIQERATQINKAVNILSGLRDSLDHSHGELPANLDRLYDYMQRQLLAGAARKDESKLDEVSSLMRDIKSAWDAIGSQVREQGQAAAADASLSAKG